MSERLDRLEALAETILQGLQQQREINAAMQETQNVDRAEFRAHVETSWQAFNLLANNIQEMQIDVREMQSEVRGLQTENRRILERLEAHFANGHGGES